MRSEPINSLITALSQAQGKFENPSPNRENPHYKSKYADLAKVIDASKAVMAEFGLAITHATEIREDKLILITTLWHKSGEFLVSEWPLPLGRPQEMGSALTYARRYNLGQILGIATDFDDDGEAAEDHKQRQEPGKQTRKPIPTTPAKSEFRAPDDPRDEAGNIKPPHKIEVQKLDDERADWMGWGAWYAAALTSSKTMAAINQWTALNATTMVRCEQEAPKIHDRLAELIKLTREKLAKGASS